jgi:uncharacterized membrane protein
MSKLTKKEFAKNTLLGGAVILLPVALIVMGFRWLFSLVTDLIQPLTNLVTKVIGMPEIFADILVLAGMAALCFGVGWLVTTAGGAWFHAKFDDRLRRYVPGFQMMKDIVGQFFGDASKSPFANGEVALVRLFGDDSQTEVTAIVTSKHEDGRYTIFMPTGPNPTSGNIYHVKESQVTLYPEISVSDAMRTIIACGAGTGDLLSHASGVGSEVRVSEPKHKGSELSVSSECAKLLASNGLNNPQTIANSSYQAITDLEGFDKVFVAEITHLLEASNEFTPIENFASSDWAPITRLGLSKKIMEALHSADYFCLAQLINTSNEELARIKGLGPKTVERIKEQVETLRT